MIFNCIGNECPSNDCDLSCEDGFKTDNSGCEICECNDGKSI